MPDFLYIKNPPCRPMDMPLAAGLCRFAKTSRDSWHVPGHDGGRAWPKWLSGLLSSLDTTELPQTGNLNHPAGLVRRSNELAAAAFGSGCTRMITGGSTAAIRIMLSLFTGRRGKIMLPRGSHQSIINAAALLDLELCWIIPGRLAGDDGLFSLIPSITTDDIEDCFRQHQDCKTVILTRPDYYGACLDLAAAAGTVHRHGAALLVDEAHGAHLSFGNGLLPDSALRSGADASVNSGHKTLPVMTGGAWLHIASSALESGLVTEAGLDRLMPVFQSSSPSFAIAATLDYARAWMQAFGAQAVKTQLSSRARFVEKLPDEFRAAPPVRLDRTTLPGFSRDPLRLVVRRQTDLTGTGPAAGLPAGPVTAWLSGQGIDAEFSDLTRLVLIPSFVQTKRRWDHLSAALLEFSKKHGRYAGDQGPDFISAERIEMLETEWRRLLSEPPEMATPTGAALFGHREITRIGLRDAAGQISADSIAPYPPGIAILCPGERIDRSRVDFLTQLLENKININGIEQDSLLVLK